MIRVARIWLIRLGKVLPFVVCTIVMLSYTESVIGLITNNYVYWNESVILNKPISWAIANYFEYNLQMLVVLCIISIAIETCIFNKLACGYLGVNLLEKSYLDFELEPTYIYTICIANIIVAGYLTIRGITILTRKQQ